MFLQFYKTLLGVFICTFSLLIFLSITSLQTSKFRNQFTISSKYFDVVCYLKLERPILFLSLLGYSEMLSQPDDVLLVLEELEVGQGLPKTLSNILDQL